jgi:2-polyprenyl-3-methyl-5-hydroxy-6-metoxy-1,4-benzoquinol methylase
MDGPERTQPLDADAEAIRLQAEEHPLIEDVPPATAAEHCLRLMHLRAYDEAVAHATGCDVLDVGCNTGYGTLRFARVAGRVVGVDVSPRAIEAARERAPEGRPEFVLTSGLDLPFASDSFDLVTSFQVLEHVADPAAFLGELVRVARPGGTVILATPNAATRLDPGMTPWNRFHVHEYLADELRELLHGAFAEVTILGMFGAPELYETEIRRVDAARQRIRRKTEAAARQAAIREERASRAARASTARSARPWPVRIARAVLPGFLRGWLRSVVRPAAGRPADADAVVAAEPIQETAAAQDTAIAGPEATAIDLESFLRYTVDDLFYGETDLDRAMDLLAVCRLGPEPVSG